MLAAVVWGVMISPKRSVVKKLNIPNLQKYAPSRQILKFRREPQDWPGLAILESGIRRVVNKIPHEDTEILSWFRFFITSTDF